MQDRNSTSTLRPKAGDGTQLERKRQDANWFGPSEEPQEEYIENGPAPLDPTEAKPQTSEGRPTFTGSDDSQEHDSGALSDDEKSGARTTREDRRRQSPT